MPIKSQYAMQIKGFLQQLINVGLFGGLSGQIGAESQFMRGQEGKQGNQKNQQGRRGRQPAAVVCIRCCEKDHCLGTREGNKVN